MTRGPRLPDSSERRSPILVSVIDVVSPDALESVRADLAVWRPVLDAVRAAHRLVGDPIAAPSGTLPVFLWPDRVVKLYAPASFWGHDRSGFPDLEAERAALELLAGRLPVPVPALLGEGAVGSWRYLVMERVAGRPLEDLWSQTSRRAQFAALGELGAAVAAMHAIEPEAFPSTCADFELFLAGQAADVVAIHRAKGTADSWLAPIARFVADTPRGSSDRALLHTEIGPSHVLATATPHALTLHGMIDWVETMTGDPEYDLAAVAFFVCRGDGGRLSAFLDGYGWTDERGDALARRLMRYLLLHRYAPFRWLLAQRPVPGATTIDDLLTSWIGLAR